MAKCKKLTHERCVKNITVHINGDNNGIIVISNTGIGNRGYIGQIEAPINILSNVHDNSFGFAAQSNAPVSMGESLSAQERDLLQIFRSADGRKQIEIMQFMYGKE